MPPQTPNPLSAPAITQDAGARVTAPGLPTDQLDQIFAGTHKLGVNRVTDMARTGTVTFSKRGSAIVLEGRVARGPHWLELSGEVEPRSAKQFVLTGVMRGLPDMAWAGEAPRERRTDGRFMFEAKHGRPYWRLYKIDDRPCVCDDDDCGNDFCYVDIELAPSP